MMSKTAAEPLVRISKREGTTFVQKVLVRAIATVSYTHLTLPTKA